MKVSDLFRKRKWQLVIAAVVALIVWLVVLPNINDGIVAYQLARQMQQEAP